MANLEDPQEQQDTTGEPVVGAAELVARSIMANDWKTVTIEHRGPDGTEILMMLVFWVCPICGATIAPSTDPNYEPKNVHKAFHIRQAADFDVLNQVLDTLQSVIRGEDEEQAGG